MKMLHCRWSIALIALMGFTCAGCRISPGSRYQNLKDQTAIATIRDTKSLVYVPDYFHEFRADGGPLRSEEWSLYWRPEDARDRGIVTQIASRFRSPEEAASAYFARSDHLHGYSWIEPPWAIGLGLRSEKNIIRCDRDPSLEPGSPALIRCQYMAQHGLWVHMTHIELTRAPIDLPALTRLIQDSDRSIAYSP